MLFRLVKVSYKSLSNIWNRDFHEIRTRLFVPGISITSTRTSTTGCFRLNRNSANASIAC